MKKLIISLLLLAGATLWGRAQSSKGEGNANTVVVKNRAGALLAWMESHDGEDCFLEKQISHLKIEGKMDGADLMWLNVMLGASQPSNQIVCVLTWSDYLQVLKGNKEVPTYKPIPYLNYLEELNLEDVTFTEGCYLVSDGHYYRDNFQPYFLQRDTIGPYWLDMPHVVSRLVLPATTRAIAPYAFETCTNLRELILPAALETFCFQALPAEKGNHMERLVCRAEEPPVVVWTEGVNQQQPSLELCSIVELVQEADVAYWQQRVEEHYGEGFFEKVELVVPHGAREKYAAHETGSLFSLFKNIVEEGETTPVRATEATEATEAANTHSYEIGGQPATPLTRGIVVSQGRKSLR